MESTPTPTPTVATVAGGMNGDANAGGNDDGRKPRVDWRDVWFPVSLVACAVVATYFLIGFIASVGTAFKPYTEMVYALVGLGIVVCVIAFEFGIALLVDTWCDAGQADQIRAKGGSVFLPEPVSWLIGCCCPVCLLSSSISTARGMVGCAACLPLCCCLSWCPCIGSAWAAFQQEDINERWGGKRSFWLRLIRCCCNWWCMPCAAAQMSRAVTVSGGSSAPRSRSSRFSRPGLAPRATSTLHTTHNVVAEGRSRTRETRATRDEAHGSASSTMPRPFVPKPPSAPRPAFVQNVDTVEDHGDEEMGGTGLVGADSGRVTSLASTASTSDASYRYAPKPPSAPRPAFISNVDGVAQLASLAEHRSEQSLSEYVHM